MKQNLLSIIVMICLSPAFIHAQVWEQLPAEPDGGGVTDIFYDQDLQMLYVATGSINWPSGEDGGIRRTTDDGASWQNLFDAYASRFITKGPDGHLYASVWDYPQNEGLYRSTNQGATWDLLVSVPEGNNIFSIAFKEGSPNIIFAGTRQGVYRSLDNGTSWSYSNDIIPNDAWVRAMAVGPDGTIAAGTSYGCYVSSDDGQTWDKVTGDGENDYIISLEFDQEPGKDDGMPIINLFFGSTDGDIFLATSLTLFTVSVLAVTLAAKEVTRIKVQRITAALLPVFMLTMYATIGGNFYYSMAAFTGWTLLMLGLPANPLISIFTNYVLSGTAIIVSYLALYGALANLGTTVFKMIFNIPTVIGEQPLANPFPSLYQNIPNPFKDQTRINFELPQSGQTHLALYDMAGNQVQILANETMNRGKHSVLVEKDDLAAGMYYYRLSANNTILTKKLMIK